jgi:hypothetical protein
MTASRISIVICFCSRAAGRMNRSILSIDTSPQLGKGYPYIGVQTLALTRVLVWSDFGGPGTKHIERVC